MHKYYYYRLFIRRNLKIHKKKSRSIIETTPEKSSQRIYSQIQSILTQARSRTWQAVNAEMVACYWEIGRMLVKEEQKGEERATYGKRIIADLSSRLTSDFGKGFDKSNLWNMRAFYMAYDKLDALRRELSWTHYRILLRVEKPESRTFYEAEAVNANWSTRELERQIASLLFERLALSKDKIGVMELGKKGHDIQKPSDLIKDPYVLEFVGLKQDERFLEKVMLLYVIHCLKGIIRFLPHVTSSIYLVKKSWLLRSVRKDN